MSRTETITEKTIPKDVPLRKERRWLRGEFWQLVRETEIADWRTEEHGKEVTKEVCRVGDEVIIKARWEKYKKPVSLGDIETEREMMHLLEKTEHWGKQVEGRIVRIFEYVQKHPDKIYVLPRKNYLLEIEIKTPVAELTTRRFLTEDQRSYSNHEGIKYISLHFPRTEMNF